MTPYRSQHWLTESSRPVYMAGGSVEVKSEAPKGSKEAVVPELEFDPNKTTHDEVWQTIDATYGMTAYEKLISQTATKLVPGNQGDYKSELVKHSVARYTKFYDKVKRTFMKEADDLKDKFEDAVDDIRDHTQEDLSVLKSAVEGSKEHFEFKAAMPALSEEGEVEDHFEDYLDTLKGRYFNADLNAGVKIPSFKVPILGAVLGPDYFKGIHYDSKAAAFQNRMEDWVGYKLGWLLKQKGTSKQTLEDFKQEIEARYKQYSGFDKNSAIISSVDLVILEKAAQLPPDAIGKVLEANDEQVIQRLELIQLMNPSGWADTIEVAANLVIEAAVNSNQQQAFVKEMAKHRPVSDFGDAKGEFMDMLEEMSLADVRATVNFLQQFNQGVHGEVLQHEQNIDPPALAIQVHKQLDYLLSGMLKPEKKEDQMLVRFMKTGREGRNDILASPSSRAVLFRAIKMATEHYPEVYQKQFSNIPDDVKKLRRSKDIEKPTHHDRAAQLQALIILGRQSKQIVSQLSKAPEHTGKGYMDEIDKAQVPEDAKVVKTGLRFKSAAGKRTRFKSALEQGGFSMGGLALTGAKLLGALTIASNVAQSFSETKGDFVDRLFETAERAAGSQGVIAGTAVMVGAHMAQRNPKFLKWPWLSEHGRAGVMASFKLDNLGRRLGHDEVQRFTHNNAEWRALKDPAMDPASIKELIQKAAKRSKRGQKPIIAIQDLRDVIKDETVLSTLTRGGRSARMRYLFYSKFFAAPVKPDVNHVKELCTGSAFISANPSNNT